MTSRRCNRFSPHLRRWVLERAATHGHVFTVDLINAQNLSTMQAGSYLAKLREDGFLVSAGIGPHGRLRNVLTDEGREWLAGSGSAVRLWDFGPLLAAMRVSI